MEKENSLRKSAIAAGVTMLLMVVPAVYANFAVLESLVVQGNASETVNNLLSNDSQFLAGIICFILVAVLDVVVAVFLFRLLEPVNKSWSWIAAAMRVLYAVLFVSSLVYLLRAYFQISDAGFDAATSSGDVMTLIDSFVWLWDVSYIFFVAHLMILGILVFQSTKVKEVLGARSSVVPKVFGALLVLAGIGYLNDEIIGGLLVSDYTVKIAIFTFVGELLFPIWLLLRGGKTPKSKQA